MKVSFVIPCYNSERTIGDVVREIEESMRDTAFEVILVDDGSTDGTREVLLSLAETHENITAIILARNFGQPSALLAGYRYAAGEIVVSMDDDGQAPADQAERLIAKIEEGYDAVYARYRHHSGARGLATRINAAMATRMLGKPKDLALSSFFAARKFVIDSMRDYCGAFPYIAALVLRATSRVTNVDVEHRERSFGRSNYTFRKLLGLWMNGFTAFSLRPLRAGSVAGGIFALGGIACWVLALVRRASGAAGLLGVAGAVFFSAGAILLMLGLLGEYVGRAYIGSSGVPPYVIREVCYTIEKCNAGGNHGTAVY